MAEDSAPPAPIAPFSTLDLPDEFGGNARVYVMSGNPFGIIYVLPAIIVNVLIAQLMFDFGVDRNWIVGIFVALGLAILAVPAFMLRGKISFTDSGVSLAHGKKTIDMPWSDIQGLAHDPRFGLCMTGKTATDNMSAIDGIRVSDGSVRIPLRLFGDRRFAIFYEVRDHVKSRDWMRRLRVLPISSRYPILIYGLAVAVCLGGVLAIAFFVD